MRLKSLVSDSILYAIATGFNRGALLLIFPVLLTFLSVEEYGIFGLAFSVSQMLIPFLTISGTAGILREGVTDPGIGVYLLERFIVIVLVNFLMMLALYFLCKGLLESWVLYSILLGGVNAVYELFLSFYRTIDSKKRYFYITVTKVIVVFCVVFIAKYAGFSLEKTFMLLIAGQFILILYLVIRPLHAYSLAYKKCTIPLFPIIKYTVFIIPHGLMLWVMNSSDRLIIKHYLGETQLGIYSIAYTIASVQLLVNSGIAIALPQQIYKNYKYWLNTKPRLQVLLVFGFVTLCVGILMQFGIKMDERNFHFLVAHERLLEILRFVMPGLFLSGIFQFYSIYIFYHKKTQKIFMIGLLAALFNVIANLYVICDYGILGAAISTFGTYLLYVGLMIRYSVSIERKLKQNLSKEIAIILIFIVIIFIALSI